MQIYAAHPKNVLTADGHDRGRPATDASDRLLEFLAEANPIASSLVLEHIRRNGARLANHTLGYPPP